MKLVTWNRKKSTKYYRNVNNLLKGVVQLKSFPQEMVNNLLPKYLERLGNLPAMLSKGFPICVYREDGVCGRGI